MKIPVGDVGADASLAFSALKHHIGSLIEAIVDVHHADHSGSRLTQQQAKVFAQTRLLLDQHSHVIAGVRAATNEIAPVVFKTEVAVAAAPVSASSVAVAPTASTPAPTPAAAAPAAALDVKTPMSASASAISGGAAAAGANVLEAQSDSKAAEPVATTKIKIIRQKLHEAAKAQLQEDVKAARAELSVEIAFKLIQKLIQTKTSLWSDIRTYIFSNGTTRDPQHYSGERSFQHWQELYVKLKEFFLESGYTHEPQVFFAIVLLDDLSKQQWKTFQLSNNAAQFSDFYWGYYFINYFEETNHCVPRFFHCKESTLDATTVQLGRFPYYLRRIPLIELIKKHGFNAIGNLLADENYFDIEKENILLDFLMIDEIDITIKDNVKLRDRVPLIFGQIREKTNTSGKLWRDILLEKVVLKRLIEVHKRAKRLFEKILKDKFLTSEGPKWQQKLSALHELMRSIYVHIPVHGIFKEMICYDHEEALNIIELNGYMLDLYEHPNDPLFNKIVFDGVEARCFGDIVKDAVQRYENSRW